VPTPKNPDEGREQRERRDQGGPRDKGHAGHGPPGDRDNGHGDDDRPRRRRMGREHAVHQELLQQRIGGGAPPTPEAYAKALAQWQQLPGSIVRPPTDLRVQAKDGAQPDGTSDN
jgi:hypothetical protein